LLFCLSFEFKYSDCVCGPGIPYVSRFLAEVGRNTERPEGPV